LRFFHEGQWIGRTARASVHLSRRRAEGPAQGVQAFYDRLLGVLRRPEVRGHWRLLTCRAPSGGPAPHALAWTWQAEKRRLLVAVNYAPSESVFALDFPWPEGSKVSLRELLGHTETARPESEHQRGLELRLPAWGYRVFEVAG
jgi:hypothetical protein